MSDKHEPFSLTKERLLLDNLNLRTEKHGEDRVPALDIAFSFDSANNLLAKLHPELRSTFYHAADTRDLVSSDHMPHLRFPFMGAVPWELDMPRTLLRVHDIDGNDVVLAGGRTNKFRLEMKEGGTVHWKFRVQFSEPDEDKVACLMRVMNQKIPVSLECADEEDDGDNFEQAEKLSSSGKEPSAARIEAENLFAAPSAEFSEPPLTPDDVVNAAEWTNPPTTPEKARKKAAQPSLVVRDEEPASAPAAE